MVFLFESDGSEQLVEHYAVLRTLLCSPENKHATLSSIHNAERFGFLLRSRVDLGFDFHTYDWKIK